MKKILIALLGLFALAAAPVPSITPLQTSTDKNFCTTWSINNKQHYYVTAAHCVVSDDEDRELPVPHLYHQASKVVFADPQADIAVLRGPVGSPPLKIASQDSPIGEKVTVVGYPWGWTEQMTFKGELRSNLIKDKEGYSYAIFDLTAAPGNSGSPIFNSKGEVISILQVGWSRSGNLSGGAPTKTMRTILEPYTE
jgi:serine protease Do